MIIGIGCDIVSHNYTKQLGWENEPILLNRVFTAREIKQYEKNKTVRFLAGRFAVKEAVLKSIKTGMEDGISLLDIEILKQENGSAKIELNGRVKEIAENLGIKNWLVSISHSEETSLAFVLAQ